MGVPFATGTYALGICDRCGLRMAYLDMVKERQTGLKVHEACEDEPEIVRLRRPDPVILREPRPDTAED
jgi:hypothetical protein